MSEPAASYFDCDLLAPGNYGREGKELIVIGRGAGLNTSEIGELVCAPGGQIVTLPDEGLAAGAEVLHDLDMFMGPNGQGGARKALECRLKFENAQNMREQLAGGISSAIENYAPWTNSGMPALQEDIHLSMARLSGVFNFAAPFDIALICGREDAPILHTDFGDDARKKRAVRSPSEFGTLTPVADDLISRSTGVAGMRKFAFTGRAAHAGAGIATLGGASPHSVHPTAERRWVYTIDGQSL